MKRTWPAFLALALSTCGGGLPATSPAPAVMPLTIANPMSYMVQSKNPDGNPATPLIASDTWTFVRKDNIGNQVSQAFKTDDTHAELIWSYQPFGPFVAANGDGGETYELVDGAVYITGTQDGSKPGITSFGTGWWAFDQYTPACSDGWRSSPDGLGRACRQTITYPASIVLGGSLTVDTIISEHYAMPGQTGPMERAFYGLGWGRLAWMAFNQPGCSPVDPSRAPGISAFDTGPGPAKCDERLSTNVVYASGALSGTASGWP